MKIMVLFFGVLTDVSGTGTRFYESAANTDILMQKLRDDYPGIENYNFRISLNNEIINEKRDLKDGDEIALLPPFAGG